MTLNRMRALWGLAQILHETRRNMAWGGNTQREPWPEFTSAYSHNPIAYVDLALAQADAVFDILRTPRE